MSSTPQAVVKIQKNKNITLPMWLMVRFHVQEGDFVRLEETRQGVLLKPVRLIDPSQAYFWTKEWQEGEKEVEEDIRKGRVKRSRGVKGLLRDLQK